MSAFRVGQRVRIARPVKAVHKGLEAVILALFPERDGASSLVNCRLAPTSGQFDPNSNSLSHTDRLEPILPEGAAPSTWAECAWQPEHMRAPA